MSKQSAQLSDNLKKKKNLVTLFNSKFMAVQVAGGMNRWGYESLVL
jgi:hypothetical protein